MEGTKELKLYPQEKKRESCFNLKDMEKFDNKRDATQLSLQKK